MSGYVPTGTRSVKSGRSIEEIASDAGARWLPAAPPDPAAPAGAIPARAQDPRRARRPTRRAPTRSPSRFRRCSRSPPERPFSRPGWLFEVKWDGVRALAYVRRRGALQEITLSSRTLHRLNAQFPEVVGALGLLDLPGRGARRRDHRARRAGPVELRAAPAAAAPRLAVRRGGRRPPRPRRLRRLRLSLPRRARSPGLAARGAAAGARRAPPARRHPQDRRRRGRRARAVRGRAPARARGHRGEAGGKPVPDRGPQSGVAEDQDPPVPRCGRGRVHAGQGPADAHVWSARPRPVRSRDRSACPRGAGRRRAERRRRSCAPAAARRADLSDVAVCARRRARSPRRPGCARRWSSRSRTASARRTAC